MATGGFVVAAAFGSVAGFAPLPNGDVAQAGIPIIVHRAPSVEPPPVEVIPASPAPPAQSAPPAAEEAPPPVVTVPEPQAEYVPLVIPSIVVVPESAVPAATVSGVGAFGGAAGGFPSTNAGSEVGQGIGSRGPAAGATVVNPAPAPSTAGAFPSGPAPAPSTAGAFPSGPAPAPSTAGAFPSGPAPAPATTGRRF